jgi:hypothetical protein
MINILDQLFTMFYVQSKADIMNYSLMARQFKKKPRACTFGLPLTVLSYTYIVIKLVDRNMRLFVIIKLFTNILKKLY